MKTELDPDLSSILGNSIAGLGPEVRIERTELPVLKAQLETYFCKNPSALSQKELVSSAVFLWHDFLDESHAISQNISSADGSYLHGIMHRREPDYSNAGYWFHRVGSHPVLKQLATFVNQPDIDYPKTPTFDPFAFIKQCERCKSDPKCRPSRDLLQQIQAEEIRLLLNKFLKGPPVK